MKRKNIRDKVKKLLLIILSLIIICFVILFVDFVVSQKKNRNLYENFESISYGTTYELVREKMGPPRIDISPMGSLSSFWGYSTLFEDKIGKIDKCYTYEMSSALIKIFNLRPKIMQIGFDKNGKAIAKHYY